MLICKLCGKDLSKGVRLFGSTALVKEVHRTAHYSGIMSVVREIVEEVAALTPDLKIRIAGCSCTTDPTVRKSLIGKARVCLKRWDNITGDIFEDQKEV